jgi:hypothetical protein
LEDEMELVNAQTLQGEIMKEAHGLVSGRVNTEAYNMAADIVAKNNGFESGMELKREIGNVIGKLSSNGKRNGSAAPAEKPQPEEMPKFSKRYAEWIEKNDIIPTDAAVAWFTGWNGSSYVRSELRKKGYEFETVDGNKTGYRVTKRPAKRTVEIVAADLAVAMNNGRQVEAAALIMELMEMSKKI